MQLGAGRMRRFISRRAAQIESFFKSRESSKHWGFVVPVPPRSMPMEGVGFERERKHTRKLGFIFINVQGGV
jgi:hypothetical protein